MDTDRSLGFLDPATAIERLEELKNEAVDPRVIYQRGDGAQASWKSRVQAPLVHALGSDSELSEKMRSNRYGLIAFSDATPAIAWERAFVSGVETAIGYIDAAVFELRLLDDAKRTRLEQAAASTRSAAGTMSPEESAPDPRAVFVIHGRNAAARDAMFDFLRTLGLFPIEWSQAVIATGRPSPYIGDVLKAAFGRAQAVLVLMTPDDEARLRRPYQGDGDPPHETDLTPQARANVIFEAGMAMAWDENRTVLVELGRSRPFSDIAGRHVLRVDDTTERRQELAQRLAAAGLAVDMTGSDWHSAGSFAGALVGLN